MDLLSIAKKALETYTPDPAAELDAGLLGDYYDSRPRPDRLTIHRSWVASGGHRLNDEAMDSSWMMAVAEFMKDHPDAPPFVRSHDWAVDRIRSNNS